MKARLLIAALAAAMPTHAAYAQDPEPRHPGREPLAVSGFRAELLGGYDDDGFSSGLLYGGRIGYDFAVGSASCSASTARLNDVDTHRTLSVVDPAQPSRQRRAGHYVGGRVTFALSRRFRLYGGAGYTRQKQGFFVQTAVDPAALRDHRPFERFTLDGYRLSAGAQLLLGKRAFLGAEYRGSIYEDFGGHRDQLVGSLGIRF